MLITKKNPSVLRTGTAYAIILGKVDVLMVVFNALWYLNSKKSPDFYLIKWKRHKSLQI